MYNKLYMMEHAPMPNRQGVNEGEDSRIMGASSFDELYELINALAVVPGSQANHSADNLRKKIDQVRHGHRDITAITRTFGLRKKVEQLLPSDETYRKYVLASKK